MALQVKHTPELKGLYCNANRFSQPQGTVPRLSNLYLVRRGAFHTVPGSKWVSSYDGLAPHSTSQLAVVSLKWYAPSGGSNAARYFTSLASASVATNAFLCAAQNTASGIALLNVSGATFQSLATQAVASVGVVNQAQFGDYLITAFGPSQPPNIFPTYTQLTVAAGVADTTLNVVDTGSFPNSGYVLIDNEAIQYTGVTPSSFTGCTRGALGTAAATHALNAAVSLTVNGPLFTALTSSINSTVTTIPVVSTTGFAASGYIQIDSEIIQYAGTTSTSFTGCTRGSQGTAPHSHLLATRVYAVTIPPSGQVIWTPITNNFDPSLVYTQWPGVVGTGTAPTTSVNIGTLIYMKDGAGTAWLFRAQNAGVVAYGATYPGPQFFPGGLVGGGFGTDGGMTAGSAVLTGTQSEFTAALVGLPITVKGAGASAADLVTSVSAFTDANHITLAANAGTTVANAQFAIGNGHFGDIAKDFNAANNSGTVVWKNVGQAALAPPGAAFVFQHLNNLYLWGVGTSYGSDGVSGPDALWQSDNGAPQVFNPANITFVGKGDGTTAQGGAVYSLSEAGIAATPQLVLFKDASTYSFLNAFPNASLVQVSGGLGCIAPGTIQFIGGYGVMRLSYAGVALFDGQLEHVTEFTDAIRGYLFGGLSDVTAVDMANIQKCVSTQAVNPPMYIFFAPLVGGGTTRGFGYDFGLKQWCVIDLPFSISAAAFLPQAAKALVSAYQSIIAGTNDGVVRRMFAADSSWDGTAISWSVRLPDWGFPGTPVYVRRVNPYITADGGGSAPALTAVAISGIRRSSKSFSRALNLPSSILGSMDVGEVLLSGNLKISGTGQVLIEGSDAQISEKPMMRVGT